MKNFDRQDMLYRHLKTHLQDKKKTRNTATATVTSLPSVVDPGASVDLSLSIGDKLEGGYTLDPSLIKLILEGQQNVHLNPAVTPACEQTGSQQLGQYIPLSSPISAPSTPAPPVVYPYHQGIGNTITSIIPMPPTSPGGFTIPATIKAPEAPMNPPTTQPNILAQAASSANITEGNIDDILKTIPHTMDTPVFKTPDDLPYAALGTPVARFTVYDFPFIPNTGELYQVNTQGKLFRVDLTPGEIYQVNNVGVLTRIDLPFAII
jgi:hypothetical protein